MLNSGNKLLGWLAMLALMVFAVIVSLPVCAWLPTGAEWERLCQSYDWEGAAEVLKEPNDTLFQWLEKPMERGDTPLSIVAREGNRGLLLKLLLRFSNECQTLLVNVTNGNGSTPLHRAADKGHTEVVNTLLEHGALATTTDEYGDTPLHEAAGKGHLEVVQLLLAYGASATATDKLGNTPMISAASNGNLEVAQLLLSYAETLVTTANSLGMTPLHCAASRGRSEMARFLLIHGASPTVPDESGSTPLNCAFGSGIIKVFWEHKKTAAAANSANSSANSSASSFVQTGSWFPDTASTGQ